MHINAQQSQRQLVLATIRRKIHLLRRNVVQLNLISSNDLTVAENEFFEQSKYQANRQNNAARPYRSIKKLVIIASIITLCVAFIAIHLNGMIGRIFGVRCFLPNNYLVWEATRPESDCQFCSGIKQPVILQNITRDKFYVSQMGEFITTTHESPTPFL